MQSHAWGMSGECVVCGVQYPEYLTALIQPCIVAAAVNAGRRYAVTRIDPSKDFNDLSNLRLVPISENRRALDNLAAKAVADIAADDASRKSWADAKAESFELLRIGNPLAGSEQLQLPIPEIEPLDSPFTKAILDDWMRSPP